MTIVSNTQYTLSGSQLEDLRNYVKTATTSIGSVAPTTSTAGEVGQLYLDTTNDQAYICTGKTAQGTVPETYTYTWQEVGKTQLQADWAQSDNTAADYIKNKPSIPTVNDATLTIEQNGTTLATFTANSSSNATASITAPVITMTSTDPGEGSQLAANNYVAYYGGSPLNTDYSTSEIETGALWIDGKPIYKKTFNFTNIGSSASVSKAHGISGINTVVKMEWIYTPGSGYWLDGSTNTAVALEMGPTNVAINFAQSWGTNYTGYVTAYYTKN